MMAKVVRSPPPDLRLVLNLQPDPAPEIAVVDRRPFLVGEDPLLHVERLRSGKGLFLLLDKNPFEFGGELGTHVHLPLRRGSLGRLDLAVVRDVAPDEDGALVEVDVLPLKRRRLPDPHAGPGEAQDERMVSRKLLTAPVLDQVQLLDREGIDLLLDLLRRPVELPEPRDGVRRDDPFVDRILKHRAQRPDHQPHRILRVCLRLLRVRHILGDLRKSVIIPYKSCKQSLTLSNQTRSIDISMASA
jgi:hypothetical protein